MNAPKPLQFSIAWMFVCMTILALALALLVHLGVGVAIGIVVVLFILGMMLLIAYQVGKTAIGTEKEVAFWHAVLAYVVLFFTLSTSATRYRYLDYPDMVLICIFIGSGLMLSIVPIRRGNKATKIFALPALAFFAYYAYSYICLALMVCGWRHYRIFWFGIY